jgi:hypothetical protein
MISAVSFGNDLARAGKYDGGAAPRKQMPTAAKVATGVGVSVAAAATVLGILSHKGRLDKAPEFVKIAGSYIVDAAKFVAQKAQGAWKTVKKTAIDAFSFVASKFKKSATV